MAVKVLVKFQSFVHCRRKRQVGRETWIAGCLYFGIKKLKSSYNQNVFRVFWLAGS